MDILAGISAFYGIFTKIIRIPLSDICKHAANTPTGQRNGAKIIFHKETGMKKRILAITLVLCMVLPMIPLSTIAAALATPGLVDGLSYDSPFAKDVYFTNGMPLDHWYTGLAGDAYETNFNNGTHNAATDYATYMTAFDTMAGFGDIAIDAGTVVSNGFDGEEWYNDLPTDVVNAMNTTSAKFGSYVTREITGKAHKWNKDIPENGGETTRATCPR